MATCGQCSIKFESEEIYLSHICKTTGFTPTDQDHLGERFKRVSENALKRGEARKAEK